MKWGFLLGGVVVHSDRPEVKEDVSDVIVNEFPYSMLNASSHVRTKGDDYGQITTCAGPGGYWTDSNAESDDATLHRFDKITAGNLATVHNYDDAKCNAKIMHILAEHPGCVDFDITANGVKAVHSKYLISSGDTFLKATKTLIETSFIHKDNNKYACGYLMGPKGTEQGYFHLWQYFFPATEDDLADATLTGDSNSFNVWKAVREAALAKNQKWIKLSNLVNQQTPGFFPFTVATPAPGVAPATTSATTDTWDKTLVSMKFMEDDTWSNAMWIFCSREPVLPAGDPVSFEVPPDTEVNKYMFFLENLLEHDNPGYTPTPEMHGLIVSKNEIENDANFLNCRQTRMQVLFTVTPEASPAATHESYLLHYEYEIPAVHHLLFEHAMFTYLTDSTNIVKGFVMSNNQEWNGFNYYHVGILLTKMGGSDSKAWATFVKTRGYAAAMLGADWIKLDDHSNRVSPSLTTQRKNKT